MWTSTIESKNYNKGVLILNVVFSNGNEMFNESFDMTGGSLDIVNERIKARLGGLQASENLDIQIPLGAFTPTSNPATTQEAFMAALRRVRSCQRAIQLGLMTDKDQIYIDALASLQASFDLSFIDLI